MAKRWLQQKKLKQKKDRAVWKGKKTRFHQETVYAKSLPTPEQLEWYAALGKALNNSPRAKALELRNEIKSARPEIMYFRLIDDGFLRARMYWHRNPEYYVIVELDKRRNLHRRSIVYYNRDVAYTRWCEGTIDWSETFRHPDIPETHEDHV